MHVRFFMSLIFLTTSLAGNDALPIAYGAYGIISTVRAADGNSLLLSCEKNSHFYTISFADTQGNALQNTLRIEDTFGGLNDCAKKCAQ